MIDRHHVIDVFHALLGRDPESEAVIRQNMGLEDLPTLVASVMAGDEFRERHAGSLAGVDLSRAVARTRENETPRYLAPAALERMPTMVRRALLVGACMFGSWEDLLRVEPKPAFDHVLFHHHALMPDEPPHPVEAYDFQLVQIPLRSVVPEYEWMRLPYDDEAAYQALFDLSVQRLETFLDAALVWSSRIPAFVLNYLVPQANALGRLTPRYDLRNPVHFVERLNVALDHYVSARAGTHVLDCDQLAAAFGRRFIQDDSVWLFSHGALINDYDIHLDGNRLEPTPALSALAAHDDASFAQMVWFEAVGMLRTLQGVDRVKMVCVDLDDTLWRGVLAEADYVEAWRFIEGWPLGFVEALLYLKKRGIILALVSKNDEATIRSRWEEVFGPRLSLDDFAIRKINWKAKADNIAEAIAEANVLPNSVVFVDDNPVERAAVSAAFPDIRTLGAPHYFWRRILLWSAETQVPTISAESARRTEMIQAQVVRETDRTRMSRTDFLVSLGLSVTLHHILSTQDSSFSRAFELVNKTNQFNTTGERWSLADCEAYFTQGGSWWVFSVGDRYTRYGLVGVIALRGSQIAQMVMSCRVFGLEVERSVLGTLVPRLRDEWGELTGRVVETPANRPARTIFEQCGWRWDGDLWRGTSAPETPTFVTVHVAPGEM